MPLSASSHNQQHSCLLLQTLTLPPGTRPCCRVVVTTSAVVGGTCGRRRTATERQEDQCHYYWGASSHRSRLEEEEALVPPVVVVVAARCHQQQRPSSDEDAPTSPCLYGRVHNMGGFRGEEEREEAVVIIVGSCRSARQARPPPPKCRCSATLLLPFLRGRAAAAAAAATAVLLLSSLLLLLPQCQGAEAGDDDSSPQHGYNVPEAESETMTYPADYNGDWLVVKMKRLSLWRRAVRRYATTPRRVKKLARMDLNVFEMECFVLDEPLEHEVGDRRKPTAAQETLFDKRMNSCTRKFRRIKGRGHNTPLRYTYAIAEDYRNWILDFLRAAHQKQLANGRYAAVTVYYNCQRRRDGDTSDAKCHGDSVSEFYPALVNQYHHDTLTVHYTHAGRAEEDEHLPAISFGEVAGRVNVRPGQSMVLVREPDDPDDPEQLSGDARRATGIRTNYLSPPELQFGQEWEEMRGIWSLGTGVFSRAKYFYYEVETVGAGRQAELFESAMSRGVRFSVLDIPEMYLYTPSGSPQSTGRGKTRTRKGGMLSTAKLHIRLQKKWFRKTSIKEERGVDRWMVVCGTDPFRVARCLHDHKALWTHRSNVEVFVSSNDYKLLESFAYSTAKEKLRTQFAQLKFLSDMQRWVYVLEGGWTGKTKLLVKRGSGAEEVSKVMMTGVTKSPVLKTKFSIPLVTSYMQVVASLPTVIIGNEETSNFCIGDLRVTFDPMSSTLSYQPATDAGWTILEYNSKGRTRGPVVLTIGLTERLIHDKVTGRQQLLPVEWTGVRIESSSSASQQLEAAIECPEQSAAFHERVSRARRLSFMWRHGIILASPRLVDDVSPRQAKTGWFKRLFGKK